MNSARSEEEVRLIAEQAIAWVLRPPTTEEERKDCLRWLLESPVHIREVLAAMAWAEEIPELLDPDRHIDVDALVAATVSNVISVPLESPPRHL